MVVMVKALLIGVCSGLALQGIEKGSQCTPLSDCSHCTPDAGCGWCDSTQECMVGGDDGPEFSNCTEWSYFFCRDQGCISYANCQSCVRDPFCGFCAEDGGSCMNGLASGPLYEDCTTELWSSSECNLAYDASLRESARKLSNLRFTSKGGDPITLS